MGDGELKEVGVRLVTENEASFAKSMSDVQKQITQAIQAVSSLAGAAGSAATGNIPGLIASLAGLAGSASGAEGGIGGVLSVIKAIFTPLGFMKSGLETAGAAAQALSQRALILATTIGNILSRAIIGLVQLLKTGAQKMGVLGWQALQTASRFEQMTMASYLMGQRMGFANDETQGFIDGLRDAGIRAEEATQLIIEMSRAEMDLSKSVELARVAQNAAVVAGRDSTDTLSRLTHGIMTYNTMVLRSAGITITGTQAYSTYAAELGKTTKELTAAEKQQAMFNAVLAEGEKITGFYELSMQNASKVMKSIPRVIDDIKIAIGTPFQKAFFDMVNMVYQGSQKVSDALGKDVPSSLEIYQEAFKIANKEGKDFALVHDEMIGKAQESTKHWGALKENVEVVGAVISWFTEKIANLGKDALPKLLVGLGNIGNSMRNFATNAFAWGWNLVQQYGAGIVKGAARILTSAMQFISNLLTGWLRPASPPKVLPEIDKWGGRTLEEWLGGMTQADFSALNEVSSIVEQMFQSMGTFDPGTMLNIEKGLMSAFETGDVSPDLLKMLSESFGKYGNQVADMVTKQVELASALNEVAKAEAELNKLREEASDQHDKVSEMVKEYNKLVKEGADPEVLKAKREAILVEQEALKAKKDQVDVAEKSYKEAAKEAGPLQEQIQLQQARIQQLMKMLDLQKQAKDLAEKEETEEEEPSDGGGGGEDIPEPDLGDIGGDLGDLGGLGGGATSLQKAIKKAMDDIWEDMQEWWQDNIKPTLDNIKTAWEDMTSGIKAFWKATGIGDTVVATWNKVKAAFGEALPNIISNFISAWEAFWSGFESKLSGAKESVWGIVDSINGFIEVAGLFAEDFITAFETISMYLPNFAMTTGELFGGITAKALEWGDDLLAKVLPKVEEFESGVREWLGEGGLDTILQNAGEGWANFKTEILTALDAMTPNIETINTALADLLGLFSDIALDALDAFTEFSDQFPGLGETIGSVLGKIGVWLSGKVATGLQNFVGWLTRVYNKMKEVWEERGPEIMATFQGVWRTLKATVAAVSVAFLNIFRTIKNAIKSSLGNEGGTGFIDKFVNFLIKAGPIVAGIISGIGGFFAFMAGVINGVIKAVIVIIRAFIMVVKGIYNIVAGVITAVVSFVQGFIALITGDFETLGEKMTQIWESVKQIFLGIFQAIFGSIGMLLGGLIGLIAGFVESVVAFFVVLWQKLVGGSIIPDMVNAIIEWFVKMKDKVVEWVTNLVNTAIEWFTALWQKIVIIVTVLFHNVTHFFNAIKDKVVEKVTELKDKAIEFFTTLWEKVTEKVKQLWTDVVQFFTDLYNDVSAKVSQLWTDVVQFFTDLYNDVSAKVSQLWTDVVQFFEDTYTDVTTKVSQLWTDVVQFFEDIYTDVTTKVSQLWTDAVGLFTDLYTDALEQVDTLWADIGTSVTGGVADFKLAVSGLISAVVGFFTETDWLQVGVDVVQGIANGLTSAVDIIWDAVQVLGGKLLEAIQKFLHIGSPSKLAAMEVGLPFAEGIAMGVTAGTHAINKAALQAISGTVAPAMRGSAAYGGGNSVENNMTKQYNLSVISNSSPSTVTQSFEMMEAFSI